MGPKLFRFQKRSLSPGDQSEQDNAAIEASHQSVADDSAQVKNKPSCRELKGGIDNTMHDDQGPMDCSSRVRFSQSRSSCQNADAYEYDFDEFPPLSTSYMGTGKFLIRERSLKVPNIHHFHRPDEFSYKNPKRIKFPYSLGMKSIFTRDKRNIIHFESGDQPDPETESTVSLSKYSDGRIPVPDSEYKIEQIFWPAPLLPAAVPEFRQQFYTTDDRRILSTEALQPRSSEDSDEEQTKHKNQLQKDIEVISKLRSPMAKAVLEDLKLESRIADEYDIAVCRLMRTVTKTPHWPSHICRERRGESKRANEQLTTIIRSQSAPRVMQPTYPYEQLRTDLDRSLPEGLLRNKLEMYLTDHQFSNIFEMSRSSFYALPKWKQVNVKKRWRLF